MYAEFLDNLLAAEMIQPRVQTIKKIGVKRSGGEQGETLESSLWEAFLKNIQLGMVWDSSTGKAADEGDARGCFRI